MFMFMSKELVTLSIRQGLETISYFYTQNDYPRRISSVKANEADSSFGRIVCLIARITYKDELSDELIKNACPNPSGQPRDMDPQLYHKRRTVETEQTRHLNISTAGETVELDRQHSGRTQQTSPNRRFTTPHRGKENYLGQKTNLFL